MTEQQWTEEQVEAEIQIITKGYKPGGEFFATAIEPALAAVYGNEEIGYPSMAAKAADRPNGIAARRYPVVAEAIRRIEEMRVK
jgi:hypothetical protein